MYIPWKVERWCDQGMTGGVSGWRGGGGVTMPPDLTPETRPLAENPIRSCEDDTRSPPPLPGTADHSSSSTTGGGLQLAQESPAATPSPANTWRVGHVCCRAGIEAGMGTRGAAPSAPPVVNTYHLSPQLKAAFASVGATDSAYSFREVFISPCWATPYIISQDPWYLFLLLVGFWELKFLKSCLYCLLFCVCVLMCFCFHKWKLLFLFVKYIFQNTFLNTIVRNQFKS